MKASLGEAISSKDSRFSPSPSFPFTFFSFISPTVRKTPPKKLRL
jgi:hypothetical protein